MSYISIEGLEGAGKSTAMKALMDYYKGKDVEQIREPGGSGVAEEIRCILKDLREEKIDAYSEALLFFAARNQLLQNVVKPALEQNKIVISDRCYLSSVAYQREEPELIKYLVKELKYKPDLIIYLDIDPRIGMERARNRGALDRIEEKEIKYFDEARKVYQSEALLNKNIVTIDASQSVEAVYNDVMKEIKKFDLSLNIKIQNNKKLRNKF